MKTIEEVKYKVVNGTSYNVETNPTVVQLLEQARQSRARVQLYYGDAKTGRDWCECHDVRGTIGRSMGPIKIPLLVSEVTNDGGFGVLDSAIVRLKIGGKEVWRHEKYHQPQHTIKKAWEEFGDHDKNPFEVYADGKLVARFKTETKAKRYLDRIK